MPHSWDRGFQFGFRFLLALVQRWVIKRAGGAAVSKDLVLTGPKERARGGEPNGLKILPLRQTSSYSQAPTSVMRSHLKPPAQSDTQVQKDAV